MKKTKTSLIIFFMILVTSLIVFFVTPEYDISSLDLSKVENKVLQHGIHEYVTVQSDDYFSSSMDFVYRVNLQNVTDEDLKDISAILVMEDFRGNQETFEKVFDLGAGEKEEIVIVDELSNRPHYIESFEISVNGSDYFEPIDIEDIADQSATQPVALSLIGISFCALVANAIQLSRHNAKKNKHVFGDPTIEKEHRYEETSEELKERLRIKKLELQQKYGHVKSTSSVRVTCEYCGMREDYEKGRCPSCGARLRLK